jgi:hypothetical protein
MKCLLLTEPVLPEGASDKNKLYSVRNQLAGLGIKYDRQRSDNISDYAAISAAYDFVCIPYVGDTGFRTMLNSALLTIPVIIAEMGNTTAVNLGNTPGIQGTGLPAASDAFFQSVFCTSPYMATNARWATPHATAPGVPLLWAAATSPIDASAQTEAGLWGAWRTTKAGAGGIYANVQEQNVVPFVAFLIQAAYNNGDFTASQMAGLRRLPLSIDMDHLSGAHFTDINILNRWLTQIPSNGMSWCGINNASKQATAPAGTLTLSAATVGTGRTLTSSVAATFASTDETDGAIVWCGGGVARVTGYTSGTVVTAEILIAFPGTSCPSGTWGKTYYNSITNMSAGVKAALQAAHAAGRIKFCYHDHSAGKEHFSSGFWPFNTWGGTMVANANVTKAIQDSHYQYLKSIWEAAGFSFDLPSFYVPASNAWNEDTLLLHQPRSSLAASPDNSAAKVGYGTTMVRQAYASPSSRPTTVMGVVNKNGHIKRDYFAGMTFVWSADLSPTDAGLTESQCRSIWQWFLYALHFGGSVYLHDEDFIDTQNPITGEYGVELLSQLNQMGAYLTNVSAFWADQTKYSLG